MWCYKILLELFNILGVMAFIYNLKKKPINTIPKVVWKMNAETYQVKHTNASIPHTHTTPHTLTYHISHPYTPQYTLYT